MAAISSGLAFMASADAASLPIAEVAECLRELERAHPAPRRLPRASSDPASEGGATALVNLVLLCSFHHLIAVHRSGWTLALNGDGTTTATSRDGKRVLHSHGPPAVPLA